MDLDNLFVISDSEIKELESEVTETLQGDDLVKKDEKDDALDNQREVIQTESQRRELVEKVYNSLDDRAKEAWAEGWKPKELFNPIGKDGETKVWVDYEEFLEKKKLFPAVRRERENKLKRENSELARKIKEQDERIEVLLNFAKSIEERTLSSSAASLEQQIKQAKELGDVDNLEKLLEAKYKLDSQKFDFSHKAPSVPDVEPLIDPYVEEWEEKNSYWVGRDPEMTAFAEAYVKAYLPSFEEKGIPVRQRFDFVDQALKKAFPDRIKTNQAKFPPISNAASAPKSPSPTITLTEKQLRDARVYINAGLYKNLDEYKKSLIK